MRENKSKEYSINLQVLTLILWRERMRYLLITLVFILVGAWYAFSTPEQFISEGKILPELQSKGAKFGDLAGLADLAGFDLSNIDALDAIRPDLYPDILKSTPFFLSLFNKKITTKDNKSITFEKYYFESIENAEEIDKKNLEKPAVKVNGFLLMNRITEERIKDLKDRIQANIDKKSGIITISVKMPDPVVAAAIAEISMTYLTDYVTRYRIDKAKKDLDFLEERVNFARGKYYINQTKKAEYSDQFQQPTIRLQSADVQRERIESEYRLSSSFYNELLKKYEEAKLKVQQETPVFQTLDPPIAPTEKSEPRRVIILLLSLILGSIIASLVIIIRKENYKKILKSYTAMVTL